MPLTESEFMAMADSYIEALFEELEAQDEEGILEVDETEGGLTIELEDGKQFVLSKNVAALEMWLSSPISGGLHFQPMEDESGWQLPDGRTLSALLSDELSEATGQDFHLVDLLQ